MNMSDRRSAISCAQHACTHALTTLMRAAAAPLMRAQGPAPARLRRAAGRRAGFRKQIAGRANACSHPPTHPLAPPSLFSPASAPARLPLPPTHARTDARTHGRTDAHTHKHTRAHTHTHTFLVPSHREAYHDLWWDLSQYQSMQDLVGKRGHHSFPSSLVLDQAISRTFYAETARPGIRPGRTRKLCRRVLPWPIFDRYHCSSLRHAQQQAHQGVPDPNLIIRPSNLEYSFTRIITGSFSSSCSESFSELRKYRVPSQKQW